jgi:predicted metal-dependent hydrolase
MKETCIPELGKVQFTKRKQSKSITVRYDPVGKLKVSLPQNISINNGIRYINHHKAAIKKKVETIQQKHNLVDYTRLTTKWHKVILRPGIQPGFSYQIKNFNIIVDYPTGTDVKDNDLQTITRKGIEEALRKEAKAFLPNRLHQLADKHQFSYNNLYIKHVKSLWGSCSSSNNINLNIHLMRLPSRLIDYVLLHELCHTMHKNHSIHFWNLLEQCIEGDMQSLKKELRDYTPRI